MADKIYKKIELNPVVNGTKDATIVLHPVTKWDYILEKPTIPTVDQSLNPDSNNAISNSAVAAQLSGLSGIYIPQTSIGQANGVAGLDSTQHIPVEFLPSSIDEIIECESITKFPTTGVSGKIYVAIDTNLTYRWSGSQYVEISPSLALGETSGTAYRGDRGKTAYDHSQNSSVHHTITVSNNKVTQIDNTPIQDTTYSNATNKISGLMSSADKAKLDSIDTTTQLHTIQTGSFEENAVISIDNIALAATYDGAGEEITNKYALKSHNHPATQITGLATVATSGKYTDLTDKPSILAVTVWNNEVIAINGTPIKDTTYNLATVTVPGLMSSSDKSKLDNLDASNIEEAIENSHTHSNKTVLDTVTAAKLHTVTLNSDNTQAIQIDGKNLYDNTALHSVPRATTSIIGGFKLPATTPVSVDTNGVLSINNYTTASATAAGTAGLVPAPSAGALKVLTSTKGWDALTPDDIGAAAKEATGSVSGGIKLGNGFTLDSSKKLTMRDFVGAETGSAGENGLVPAPQAADDGKFLKGDGTWTTITASSIGAAASSHNHSASNITSGTISTDRLPKATTTTTSETLGIVKFDHTYFTISNAKVVINSTYAHTIHNPSSGYTEPVIDKIDDTVLVAEYAKKDNDGNTISSTYAKKSDFSAYDNVRAITAANITSWNGKQAAITDLATIRSGAAAGATAVQPAALNNYLPLTGGTINQPSTTTAATFPLVINNPGSATNIGGLNILAASMAANQNLVLGIGKANSNYNRASIVYSHVGNGSTSNYLAFSIYGKNNILTVVGTERVGIKKINPSTELDVNGVTNSTSYMVASVATIQYNANAGVMEIVC